MAEFTSVQVSMQRALAKLAAAAAASREPLVPPEARAAEASARFLAYLRDGAPKKTGAFAAALEAQIEVATGTRIAVRATGPQPLFDWITKGTAPHEIRPSAKQALSWPGAAHPVALVHHPGTKPNPFAQEALAKTAADLKEELVLGVTAQILAAIRAA